MKLYRGLILTNVSAIFLFEISFKKAIKSY